MGVMHTYKRWDNRLSWVHTIKIDPCLEKEEEEKMIT